MSDVFDETTIQFKEVDGEKLVRLSDYIAQVQKTNDAMEHLLSCFSQGTHYRPDYEKEPNKWVYDHGCLSAYEDAQDFLIEHGVIKLEECSRR